MKILTARKSETIIYAAEELAKYLKMMDGTSAELIDFGNADIKLGLFSDLGLSDDDVNDAMLDDVIEVEICGKKGYISGSNERSVLMGVYTYLKSAGCRWVRPGDAGEYIPKKNSIPDVLKAYSPLDTLTSEGIIGLLPVAAAVG